MTERRPGRSGRVGWRRFVGAVVVDTEPLRVSVPFRRLWFGLTVSQLGQQMTQVAVAIQVYDLTRSSFAVGLVGGVSLVPLVVFGLYGGAIADVVDRRVLGVVTSCALWVLSGVLLAQALLGLGSVALVYVVVGLQAACFAVNNATRSAMIPRLVPPLLLPAANALGQISFNLGFTVGPLIGGAVIAVWHVQSAYGVDVVTFTAALYAMWRLPSIPPEGPARRAGLRTVVEGFAYLGTRRNVLMTFLLDIGAMVLAQPRALFPGLAAHVFGGGSRTVGLLMAAPAIGALGGALFSGWLGRVRRQGLAVVLAVLAWGAAVTGFGLSSLLWLGVVLLAVAGCADMVSAVYRNTIMQVASPDRMRGRLQGVFTAVVAGGPRLGDMRAGTVATWTGEPASVVIGGLACMVTTVLLAVGFPRFVRYDSHHPAA
ncbi:MAG: MFS transporter [Streptosporangiales bacterium]|nr:MFS transporter [Streptosporangiales bacterium]MBO0890952.1 MFS transporter [Acidothermales bacterium]